MRNTFNIGFVCRESKTNKLGLAPIELTIIICGERSYLTLQRKEKPALFRKKYCSTRQNELKEYLSEINAKVQSKVLELMKQDVPVTTSALRAYLKYGGCNSYKLQDLFDEYLGLLQKRIGITLTAAVYRKYEIVNQRLIEHLGNKELKSITCADTASFYAYLDSLYESTTSAGMMTKFKTVMLYAFNSGKTNTNAFATVKITKRTKEVELFTISELQRMLDKKFVSKRVEKIRDLFCFAAGSGLAFCDCMSLEPQDFVEQGDEIYIRKHRQKTGTMYTAILTSWAKDIAKKYNYDFSALKISNQKTNQTLKDIQDACEITSVDSLTFHKARHFYITYLITSGVPVSTVKELVGHSNIAMTNHYTHLRVDNLIDDFKKFVD